MKVKSVFGSPTSAFLSPVLQISAQGDTVHMARMLGHVNDFSESELQFLFVYVRERYFAGFSGSPTQRAAHSKN